MTSPVIFSEEEIQARVRIIAAQINQDFRGEQIVLVGLLNGCVLFLADLAREIERGRSAYEGVRSCTIEFMRVSSYDEAQESRGRVNIEMDVQKSPKGKHVIIVDEVAETLLTTRFVVQHLRMKSPASVRVCVLITKPDRHKCAEVKLDYVGFSQRRLPFLKGYGMDDGGVQRGLPYIAACE